MNTDPNATDPSPASPPRPPQLKRALLGLGLTLAGPASYMAFLGVPWNRSTAAPAIVLMLAGSFVGLVAARRSSRIGIRLLGGFNVALTAVFLVAMFGLMRLPAASGARQLTQARDFTLPDQNGIEVTLSEELKKGPVLLVFYRGFW